MEHYLAVTARQSACSTIERCEADKNWSRWDKVHSDGIEEEYIFRKRMTREKRLLCGEAPTWGQVGAPAIKQRDTII